jgi:hypothetical protein
MAGCVTLSFSAARENDLRRLTSRNVRSCSKSTDLGSFRVLLGNITPVLKRF